MTRLQRILIAALFLFLPSANILLNLARGPVAAARDKTPITILLGLVVPASLLSLLALIRLLRRNNPARPRSELGPSYRPALIALLVAATLSLLINEKTPESATYYVVVFIEGALTYFVFSDLEITDALRSTMFGCLAIGSLFMLIAGAVAFYRDFGWPDSETLLFARFDVVRFAAYQDMTFGNVNQTVSFLIIVYPAFVSLLFLGGLRWYQTLLYVLTIVMLLVNAAICQMRTSYVVILLSSGLVLAFFRVTRVRHIITAVAAATMVAAILFLPVVGSLSAFEERYSAVVSIQGTESDDSGLSRLDAMRVAWNIFENHWAFGVGPDQERLYNPHGTAHQFNIQQGADLGILGLLASVLVVAAVVAKLALLVIRGPRSKLEQSSFLFLIGPFTHVVYSVIAYGTLALGPLNTWTVLLCAMLAMSEGPSGHADLALVERLAPVPNSTSSQFAAAGILGRGSGNEERGRRRVS